MSQVWPIDNLPTSDFLLVLPLLVFSDKVSGGDWYVGAAEPMRHASKMLQLENKNLI